MFDIVSMSGKLCLISICALVGFAIYFRYFYRKPDSRISEESKEADFLDKLLNETKKKVAEFRSDKLKYEAYLSNHSGKQVSLEKCPDVEELIYMILHLRYNAKREKAMAEEESKTEEKKEEKEEETKEEKKAIECDGEKCKPPVIRLKKKAEIDE